MNKTVCFKYYPLFLSPDWIICQYQRFDAICALYSCIQKM